MTDKITVIIPVYNVEKYVGEALDSVINQTYKNLEIIVIDDESKDSSGDICEEYAKKDNRITVVHQKNKGLSGARNTGLDLATGKYIMFLDSDDKFELDACENFYKEIEKTNAEYVVGNYIYIDEDGTKWEKPVFDQDKYKEFKLSIEDYKNSFFIMNSTVWNKIFRRSFLEELKMKFVERVPAEDAIFTTYCFIKSSQVYYMPKIMYNYRMRYSDSISNSCSKEYFMGINKAYKIIYENFKENNRLDFYRFFYAKSMNYILYKFIDSTRLTLEERIEVLDKMKWFYMLSNDLKIPTIFKSVQYIINAIEEKDYAQALRYCEILNQVRKILPKELKEKMSKPNADTYREMEETKMDIELLHKKEELLKEMEKSNITILGIEESLTKIKEGKSIARFGDGELDIIIDKDLKFQEHNSKLAERLKGILADNQEFCLIGIPDVINKFENLTFESEAFWIDNMYKTRKTWLKYINDNMEYCTANLTRPYIRHKDRSECGKYFSIIKEIWKDKDVVVCEGEQTGVGVGNDLLEGCKSVRRVLCPAEDAFNKYDEIINRLKQEPKDVLIILALGPTATVLAYDLAKEGYQALDMGHIDIEYEWYRRNVSKRERIENKYTNEVEGGNQTQELKDNDYLKQIDTIIK